MDKNNWVAIKGFSAHFWPIVGVTAALWGTAIVLYLSLGGQPIYMSCVPGENLCILYFAIVVVFGLVIATRPQYMEWARSGMPCGIL
ncbi:MAG TPA: hypothetical protein VIH14_03920 [Anaerolineales bacterium]